MSVASAAFELFDFQSRVGVSWFSAGEMVDKPHSAAYLPNK